MRKTGGHFACACVHQLNDNSVYNSVGASNLMAGNKKLACKITSFSKPFRWCFEYRTFLQKILSMTKIVRFVRGFLVVDFSALA